MGPVVDYCIGGIPAATAQWTICTRYESTWLLVHILNNLPSSADTDPMAVSTTAAAKDNPVFFMVVDSDLLYNCGRCAVGVAVAVL